MKTRVAERGARFLARLNPREKLLIFLMVAMFSLMGAFIVIRQFNDSLSTLNEEIQAYDRALVLLVAKQEDFAQQLERAERISAQLEDNDLQLHTFIEQQCLDANVARPSNYNDSIIPQRDQQSGIANIVEVETRATINGVDPAPLARLLSRLANSDELVLLKAIDIQPARGQRGRFRVDLTVSTYRLEPEDDS